MKSFKIAGLLMTALLLTACEGTGGSIEFPKVTLFEQIATGAPAPAEEPLNRGQICDFARKGLGMPILVDPTRRREAYESLGKARADELFRPLARANNSFRCVCGTPEEKLKAKC